MKKRVLEAGKTLLIILLFCSLLLLTVAAMPMETIRSTPWLSTLLQPLAPILGLPEAELAYVESAQSVSNAARPLRISVTDGTGRQTAQWSFGALDETSEHLSGLLVLALDTAGDFTQFPENRLPEALTLPSVCFDYGMELPAPLLGSWLDTEPDLPQLTGQYYILSLEEEQVALYLLGEDCFRASTEIHPRSFTDLLAAYSDDGSRFAFETGSHLTPLAMVPGSDPVLQAAVSASPCDARYIESLATALGFNPYDETRYSDSSGVTYFSETNCSLQIAASGEILLTSSSSDRFRADDSTLEVLVEEARSMVQLAVGDILGDARIYLSGITADGEQTTLTFDYVLDGIAVSCGSRPAAVISFSGQSVTSMELLAASFTLTGETLKVLPAAQAAAIIPADGDLILQYDRASDGTLTAGWVK